MYKNLAILSACHALMLAGTSLIITSAALVGLVLAPRESLATVPLGICYGVVMLSLIPVSVSMQKYGRKFGFYCGASSGLAGGILAGVGIYTGSFLLFCLAAAFYGVGMASAQFYRFAAAELASDEYRSRAISWVLAGGLVAAFLGPAIAKNTRDLASLPPFTLTFSSIIILCTVILLLLPLVKLPAVKSDADSVKSEKRPLNRILLLPAFMVAAACAMVAYGTMNLLMVSTPLAMQGADIDFSRTATVIQWHIVGMYAPSFFTGSLIHRFGVFKIMLAGLFILLCCIGSSVHGSGYGHFLFSLVTLGVGWNFLYIGGTTLLTDVYKPSEKGIVQGVNDFLVFSGVATTAAVSGILHYHFGWMNLNLLTVPMLILVGIGVLMLWWSRSRDLSPA